MGYEYDVTFVGHARFADGMGRVPIALISTLFGSLKMNGIPTRSFEWMDLPISTLLTYAEPQQAGRVALVTDWSWSSQFPSYEKVPSQSLIKIVYCMVESTRVNPDWIERINRDFDAIVVPDPFLIEVYQNSGLTLPIFLLPLASFLEDFLEKPEKTQAEPIFTFSNLSHVGDQSDRKNHSMLIEAFAKAFGNDPSVQLRMNARLALCQNTVEVFRKRISELKLENVHFFKERLLWKDYVEFFDRTDCYVSLSKGEGFSIPPREALARGIPCILTDNTAHRLLCETDFFRAVPSRIQEPATCFFTQQPLGCQFNCSLEDAVAALRDVYENYPVYLKRAQSGRPWVKQYLSPNLKNRYLNLIKPKKILLGPQNEIGDDYLMTSCSKLYHKYSSFQ